MRGAWSGPVAGVKGPSKMVSFPGEGKRGGESRCDHPSVSFLVLGPEAGPVGGRPGTVLRSIGHLDHRRPELGGGNEPVEHATSEAPASDLSAEAHLDLG